MTKEKIATIVTFLPEVIKKSYFFVTSLLMLITGKHDTVQQRDIEL